MSEISPSINELLRNRNFLKLHNETRRFNIFEATGMADREVKHTQFLAHLLNPHAPHGLGQDFLSKFLSFIPAPDGGNHSPMNLIDFDYLGAEVKSEVNYKLNSSDVAKSGNEIRRIDLQISIPSLSNPSDLYIIVIENKLRAKQGEGQLEAYEKVLRNSEKVNGALKVYLVYLTLVDDEDVSINWSHVTYENVVVPAINEVLAERRETISDYLHLILGDYIELLKGLGGYQLEGGLDSFVEACNADKSCREAASKVFSSELKDPLHKRFKLFYGKALDELKAHTGDIRLELKKEFDNLFNCKFDAKRLYGGVTHSAGLELVHEGSSLTYLNFSILTPENQRRFEAISEKLSGVAARSLVVQIEFRPAAKDELKKVRATLKLMLGPTLDEFSGRLDLYRELVKIFNPEKTVEEVSPRYSTVCSFPEYKEFSLEKDEAIKWMDKVLRDALEGDSLKAYELNKVIDAFFESDRI